MPPVDKNKQQHKTVRLFYPTIEIRRGDTPLAFVDTFMWDQLLSAHDGLEELIRECCEKEAIVVVLTNVIEGELKQRRILGKVQQICTGALVTIPIGRIAANQVVQAMVCYYEKRPKITLTWDLAISDVPVLGPPVSGLRFLVSRVADEINSAVGKFPLPGEEKLVPALVGVEREIWKDTLRAYGDLLTERHPWLAEPCKEEVSYEQFFFTDYFTDLPFVVLRSYLFAYVLKERPLRVQDVVDILCISEIVPYSMVYIVDRDQHNRIKQLQKHYPLLFGRLDEFCCIASFLESSAVSPTEALESFLEYAKRQQVDK